MNNLRNLLKITSPTTASKLFQDVICSDESLHTTSFQNKHFFLFPTIPLLSKNGGNILFFTL